jgi:hypothetical protein
LTKVYIFNALRVILLSIIITFFNPGLEAQSRKVRKAEKHKEKVDRQEERKYEKSKEAAIKAHNDRQSDKTKDQMKQSKKKSQQFNNEKKYGFFEGIIKTKKAKKEYKKRSTKQKR